MLASLIIFLTSGMPIYIYRKTFGPLTADTYGWLEMRRNLKQKYEWRCSEQSGNLFQVSC